MSVLGSNTVAVSSAPLASLVAGFERAAALSAGPKHVRSAAAIVRSFLWSARISRPDDISTAAVAAYLAESADQGARLKTIWNHRSAISSFCQFLVGRGLLAVNPCPAVRLRKPPLLPARWLTPAELEAVLSIAAEQDIWPEVALPTGTGLRLAELIRLEWRDVDSGLRQLLVRESKSGRPRTVPLNELALAALDAQRQKTGGMRFVFPARQTWRGGWRFVDRPRASNWWRRAFKPIQQAVAKFRELPGCCTGRAFHLLRHTFASMLARDGVSIYKISRWVGHKSVDTTARFYAHLSPAYDPDIERAMPAAAGSPRKGARR